MSRSQKILSLLLGFLAALVFSIWLRHALAWETASYINSAPWQAEAALKVELRYSWMDFGFGGTGIRRDHRLKGSGIFDIFSTDEASLITEKLIKEKLSLQNFRIYEKELPKTPLYHANKQFYLVSVDPPTVVMVQHRFTFLQKSKEISINEFQGNVNMNNHEIIEKRRLAGLSSLVSGLDKWLNCVDLSPVIPDSEGIEVLSNLWDKPVSLQQAINDPRWSFTVQPSKLHSGYLLISPREPRAGKLNS